MLSIGKFISQNIVHLFSISLSFVPLKLLSIDRFHCHATKKYIGNRPVEEAKKMNVIKD